MKSKSRIRSDEKINSGLRIIEVEVRDERDVDNLRKGIVSARANINEYNLKEEKTVSVSKCPSRCKRTYYTAIGFKSGKHLVEQLTQGSIKRHFYSKDVVDVKVFEDNDHVPDIIEKNVRDRHTVTTRNRAGFVAFAEFALNFQLKNCFNCKHSALLEDKYNLYGVSYNRFYCEQFNRGFYDYDTAAMCKSYNRDDPLSVADRFRIQLVQRKYQ